MTLAIWAAIATFLMIGCGDGGGIGTSEDEPTESADLAISFKHLFTRETWTGNGRTCETCHSEKTGTFSPEDAQQLFRRDPHAPLFRAIDSDDGTGASYERLLTHATVLINLPLPPNVRLDDDPTATHVTLERGSPTTLNVGLEPQLMLDAREDDLEDQAIGAINAHMEPRVQPSRADIENLVRFERKIFSSKALERLMWHGHDPGLPRGDTESERRGRIFFEQTPFDPADVRVGFCAHCHSGPMMNTTNEFALGGLPAGARLTNALVSELNARALPERTYLFTELDGTVTRIVSPDPGRALVTGRSEDANVFKIPSLRNIRNTAPYFHDSSAKTLEDVAAHYSRFLEAFSDGQSSLSAQDQADLAAFMRLL